MVGTKMPEPGENTQNNNFQVKHPTSTEPHPLWRKILKLKKQFETVGNWIDDDDDDDDDDDAVADGAVDAVDMMRMSLRSSGAWNGPASQKFHYIQLISFPSNALQSTLHCTTLHCIALN